MEKDRLPDEMLMVLFREHGDKEAFDILYSRYYHRLFTFLQTINPSEAEDLTQRSFQRIIERAYCFDESRGTFKGWLYRIAINDSTSLRRWWSRFQQAVSEYTLLSPQSLDSLLWSALDDYLDVLSPGEREVAMLLSDGFSQSEVAWTLSISVSTVRRRLISIRTKLRARPRSAPPEGNTSPHQA